VLHFWSLAIEEQFYLLFPLLALVSLRLRGRRGLAVLLVALAVGSVAAGRLLLDAGASGDRMYYGTDTRAVELLAGALLALVLTGRDAPRRRAVRAGLYTTGAAALAAMAVLWTVVEQGDRWLYRGGLLLHALLATAVVAAAVQPGGPVRALLGAGWLRRLGVISYGVYVYHWPIFLWLDADRTGLSRLPLFGLRAAVSISIAAASYRLLERPIRAGRRLTGRRPWLVVPATVGAVAVSLIAVTADPPPPTIVYSAAFEAPATPATAVAPAPAPVFAPAPPPAPRSHEPQPPRLPQPVPVSAPVPTPPSPAGPLRVMVVGDSVAQSVGRGLERWGARTGEAVVKNSAVGLCSIGRGGVAYLFGDRPKPQGPCSNWSRWGVDKVRPDVIVVLSTLWETFPRELPEWGGIREIGDTEYDRWLVSEYAAFVDYLGSFGARVVWLTTPCVRTDDPAIVTALGEVNTIVNWLPNITAPGRLRVLDLDGHVCPNGTFSADLGGVEGARPDGLHFSDPGSDWLASWLGPQLVDAFPDLGAPA
jgi:hypothetical protein